MSLFQGVLYGALAYFFGGALTLYAFAIGSRLQGGHYFTKPNRWDTDNQFPPAVILFLWPLVIPAVLVFGIGMAFVGMLERAVDGTSKLIEKR